MHDIHYAVILTALVFILGCIRGNRTYNEVNGTNNNIEQAVDVLRSLGFKHLEAIQRVTSAYKINPKADVSELVNLAVRQ